MDELDLPTRAARAAARAGYTLRVTERLWEIPLPDGCASVLALADEVATFADADALLERARRLDEGRRRVLAAFEAGVREAGADLLPDPDGRWGVQGGAVEIACAVDERLSATLEREGEGGALLWLRDQAAGLLPPWSRARVDELLLAARPDLWESPDPGEVPPGDLAIAAAAAVPADLDATQELGLERDLPLPGLDDPGRATLDRVSEEVLAAFRARVVRGDEPEGLSYWGNWYLAPDRWLPDDGWMDREDWVTLARAALRRGDEVAPLEILLDLDPGDEVERRAREALDDWWHDGGHDAEGWLGLLVRFPAHPAAVEVLADAELDAEVDRVLIDAGHLAAERRVARRARTSRAHAHHDDATVVRAAVGELCDELRLLGRRASDWFEPGWLADVEQGLVRAAAAEGDALWLLGMSLLSCAVEQGWGRVVAALEANPWTPAALMAGEDVAEAALVLSRAETTLLAPSLAALAMESDDEDDRMAGAIAWTRLRARGNA